MSDLEYIEAINEIENVNQNNCFISISSKVDKDIKKVGLVENHVYSDIEIKDIGTACRNKYILEILCQILNGQRIGLIKAITRKKLIEDK